MKIKSKSQAALEYIFVVSFVLIALIPLFYYSLGRSSTTTYINEASDAVNIIANAADSIYTLGPGNRDYVWIIIPPSVTDSSVGNKEILLRLNIAGKISDIHTLTKAEVIGDIPIERGTHRIGLKVLDSGVVKIGEIICNCSGFLCEPGDTGRRCDGCNYVSAPNEICDDNIDNDCDGNVDCADSDCEGQTCDTGKICISGECIVLKSNGEACFNAIGCLSDYCVDGVCCDTACVGSTCQVCNSSSAAGAGTCGYVSSSSEDPDNECTQGSTSSDGCSTEYCSGSGYSCGAQSSGDGGCPNCYTCSDSDIACEYHSIGTVDGCTGAYGCSGFKDRTRNICNGAGTCADVVVTTNYCAGTCASYCSDGSCINTNTGYDSGSGTCIVSTDIRVSSGGDGYCSSSDCISIPQPVGTSDGYYWYLCNIHDGTCNTFCASHGGVASGNWNDNINCDVCHHWYSGQTCQGTTCQVAGGVYLPPPANWDNICYYRTEGYPCPDIRNSFGWRQFCACKNCDAGCFQK